jgi:hypothetical protein
VGVRTDTELLDMEKIIKDTLRDEQHVWIVLKGILLTYKPFCVNKFDRR